MVPAVVPAVPPPAAVTAAPMAAAAAPAPAAAPAVTAAVAPLPVVAAAPAPAAGVVATAVVTVVVTVTAAAVAGVVTAAIAGMAATITATVVSAATVGFGLLGWVGNHRLGGVLFGGDGNHFGVGFGGGCEGVCGIGGGGFLGWNGPLASFPFPVSLLAGAVGGVGGRFHSLNLCGPLVSVNGDDSLFSFAHRRWSCWSLFLFVGVGLSFRFLVLFFFLPFFFLI